MKKFQKLLVLSFSALLSVGVIAGCNNNTPSSPAESTPAPESSTVESTPTESESSTPVETADLAAEAKEFLEETYKETTSVMADFTLPTTHLMYDENDAQVSLNISWELEVAAGGVEGAIVKGTAADGKQPFTVKYNAADSTVATTFTITGTITDPNGHEATVTFNWSVPRFEFASFDDFKQAVADKSEEVVNVRGHVIAIYKDGLYLEDANGDGFYAYRPTDFAIDKYSVGDEILVSGKATSYSSQYEFSSGCTVQLLAEASADFAPVYEDVTAVFQAAANNKDAAFDAHQNSLVTVKGVTVDTYSNEKDSSLYYYFTIGNVRTYLRPYSGWVNPNTGAAFTMDEINALVSEWVKGYTADLKGILSIYGGAYYLSLIDDDAITYTSKELPDDAKAANAAEAAASSFKEVYVMGHTFDLPATGQSDSTLAYTVTEGTAASINNDGDLVVAPTAADSTVKVEIAATVGVEVAKYTVEFTVKGSTYETIDAAKALELVSALDGDKKETSSEWYYVSAKVGEVYNTDYCNFYLPVAENAQALIVYGLWNGQDSGTTRYGAKREIKEIPVQEGDNVVLYTQLQNYQGKLELVNTMLISSYGSTNVVGEGVNVYTAADGEVTLGDYTIAYDANGKVIFASCTAPGYGGPGDGFYHDGTYAVVAGQQCGIFNVDAQFKSWADATNWGANPATQIEYKGQTINPWGAYEVKAPEGVTILTGSSADMVRLVNYLCGTTHSSLSGNAFFENTLTDGQLNEVVADFDLGEEVLPEDGNKVEVNFSSIEGSVQYADETHQLDETLSMHIIACHVNTQLRIYSSSSNNGVATFTATKAISSITLNAGNKADTLNVYGSLDGETWTLIEGVVTTSTYTDYTVDFGDAGYKYFKLDVEGTSQVRVASLTVEYAEETEA